MIDIVDKCKDKSPLIMGVVNVTPDSFSDGGTYLSADNAINHGRKLLDQGADILDIGGESTRPNAKVISVEEEIKRVIPVIKGLSGIAPYISIDTRNSKTMAAAIKAGANIINDVSALRHDPDSVQIVADSKIPVCLMHMKGTPQNMQNSPKYDNVIDEIMLFFEQRLEFMSQFNINFNNIVIDPGIGFGKSLEHNLSIIKNISRFKEFGCPVLLGTSRKSFIGNICSENDPCNRIYGSIASVIYGMEKGIDIFRVHDVKETRQAMEVYSAILKAK